jgi:hypothetical protein
MGYRANTSIAHNTSAKTERSSANRDASTTDADVAAFMDNTDDSLTCDLMVRTRTLNGTSKLTVLVHAFAEQVYSRPATRSE